MIGRLLSLIGRRAGTRTSEVLTVTRDDRGLALTCRRRGVQASSVATGLERYALRVSNWTDRPTSSRERAAIAPLNPAMAADLMQVRRADWPIRIDREAQAQPELFDEVARRVSAEGGRTTVADFQAIERAAIAHLVAAGERADLRDYLHWSL